MRLTILWGSAVPISTATSRLGMRPIEVAAISPIAATAATPYHHQRILADGDCVPGPREPGGENVAAGQPPARNAVDRCCIALPRQRSLRRGRRGRKTLSPVAHRIKAPPEAATPQTVAQRYRYQVKDKPGAHRTADDQPSLQIERNIEHAAFRHFRESPGLFGK